MLGLPSSTEVNRRVAKEKFYANATLTPLLRDRFKDQIEAVIWRHKLADSTIGVAAGETVKEIQVFEVVLRQRDLDQRILPAIAKAIPYKLLFMLTYGAEAQAWMEASGQFYGTDWVTLEGFTLRFDGLNLDAVYASLARQIAGGRLSGEGDIADAVGRDQRRRKLGREIELLEKKMRGEKQFNRQVEMNGELRRLRAELGGLN